MIKERTHIITNSLHIYWVRYAFKKPKKILALPFSNDLAYIKFKATIYFVSSHHVFECVGGGIPAQIIMR